MHLRLGIIGMGNMGNFHAAYLVRPEGSAVANVRLAAVCDPGEDRRAPPGRRNMAMPAFATHQELLASKLVDAVLVATPHYGHVPVTLDAFAAGVHVLVEKPLAVSITEARRLAAAAKNRPELVFGIMYNQRANPLYQKMRAGAIRGHRDLVAHHLAGD